MSTDDLVDGLNYFSGVLYSILWIPQIYTSIKSKDTSQISICMLLINNMALSITLLFGIYYNIMSIYIPTILNLLFSIIMTFIKIFYDRQNKRKTMYNSISYEPML